MRLAYSSSIIAVCIASAFLVFCGLYLGGHFSFRSFFRFIIVLFISSSFVLVFMSFMALVGRYCWSSPGHRFVMNCGSAMLDLLVGFGFSVGGG